MSERSRTLPRRTCLSVPGSNPAMLAKAPTRGADMVFVDLEDSVAPSEKDAARSAAAAAVGQGDWGDTVVGVRVNAWDSPWTVADLVEVVGAAGPRLDVVMVPKVETPAQLEAVDLILGQLEIGAGLRPGHVGIDFQIETAAGLASVEAICRASDRLEAVHFGPGDYAASVEMPMLTGGVDIAEYPGDHFHHVFSRILVAARTAGLQVLDGPYFAVDDPDGLEAYCQRTRVLGYDGKWAIHPAQIPIINRSYSPSQAQFDRAVAIVDAYRRATTDDRRGAILLDGEMLDEASHKMALKLVTRGRRAGLTPSHSPTEVDP